jgi:mannose-6-phosphate isomerase-like protein (cupin superfamily)
MSTNNAYGHVNFADVKDMLPEWGMQEIGEARYLREDVGAQQLGMTFYRLTPDKRAGFAHRHTDVEEMYLVLRGSGRAKIDDDVVELREHDVLRVAPTATRDFEAGPDGLELLATGRHVAGDGEMLQGWWTD